LFTVATAATVEREKVREGFRRHHAHCIRRIRIRWTPHTARRRDQSLELLAGLTTQIRELDDAITTAALGHPDAPRLITHPGVGALTALTGKKAS